MKRVSLLLILIIILPMLVALENYGSDYDDTRPENYNQGNLLLPFEEEDEDEESTGSTMGSVDAEKVSGGFYYVADPGRDDESNGGVFTVDFGPESDKFVTAQSDGEVRLWKITKEGGIDNIETFNHDTVFQAVFSWDGKYLASAGFDKVVRLWNVEEEDLVHKMQGKYPFASVTFSKDNSQVITGEQQRGASIRFWSVSTARQTRSINVNAFDTSLVSVSRKSGYIVHSFPGGSTRIILRTPSGGLRKYMYGHTAGPIAGFSVSGDYVVSFSNDDVKDDQLIIWRMPWGARYRVFKYPGEIIKAGDVTPDGKYAFTVSNSSKKQTILRVYDMGSGRQINAKTLALSANDLAISPDGKYLAVVGQYTVEPGETEGRVFFYQVNNVAR